MRLLVIGDIVGRPGLDRLKEELPLLLKNENIDFCVVNGENSAGGKGIKTKEYDEIISYGADFVTMGNHLYYRKDMANVYITLPRLLLPANITNLTGNNYVIVEKNNVKVGVFNLVGRAEMGDNFTANATNPFTEAIKVIEQLDNENVDFKILDFHAEATAEKIALAQYLKDKINCFFGTHTHVQTADEMIFDTGMAYITDVGMVGPSDSVLGLKKEIAIERFLTEKFIKYECSSNKAIFNAIIVEFDDNTKKAISIKRINN